MRNTKILKSSAALLGCGFLAVLLAGAASAAPIVPFQPRPNGVVATGYVDVRKDASHYIVTYSAADEAQAKKLLERRAAQIGQASGYTYFVITDTGTRTLTITERNFDNNFGILEHGRDRQGNALNPMDYVPRAYPVASSKFYDVWAQVTFLTPEQARGQAGAKQVSEVLAAQPQ